MQVSGAPSSEGESYDDSLKSLSLSVARSPWKSRSNAQTAPRSLAVPEAAIGQNVRCPACKTGDHGAEGRGPAGDGLIRPRRRLTTTTSSPRGLRRTSKTSKKRVPKSGRSELQGREGRARKQERRKRRDDTARRLQQVLDGAKGRQGRRTVARRRMPTLPTLTAKTEARRSRMRRMKGRTPRRRRPNSPPSDAPAGRGRPAGGYRLQPLRTGKRSSCREKSRVSRIPTELVIRV